MRLSLEEPSLMTQATYHGDEDLKQNKKIAWGHENRKMTE